MPKTNRHDGPSIAGSTPQRDVLRFAGTDIEVSGPDADLTVVGRIHGRLGVEDFEHHPGIHRWRQKLAVARSGGLSVILAVLADSRGRSSATRWRNAWPDRLLRRFHGATPGTMGLLPPSQGTFNGILDADWAGGDSPWTFTGSVTGNVNYGVGFHAVNIPAAGTATMTYFGDRVSVVYVRTPTGPTAATVTIDGTSVGPLNANGALAAGQQAFYGTNGNYGHHTLVITPNDGTLILEGVQWFDADAPFLAQGTVHLIDGSHAGFGAVHWAASNGDWAAMFSGGEVFCGGVLVVLDANDVANFGRTPQQFEDDLVAMVADMDNKLGNGDVSWFFVHLPSLTDARFVQSTRNVTRRIGVHRAAVVDLAAIRPGRVFGTDLSADTAHPTDAGMIWVAEVLGDILDPAPPSLQPVTPKRVVIDASTAARGRSSWTEAWTALTGGIGGYDQSGGGATVGERRHGEWLDPGTYRATVTMQEDTGLGNVEVLVGRWAGNTPTLTSCGSKTNAAGSPTLVTTRLGTSITTQVPGYCPIVIRKTSATGAIRFVQLVLDKTA